MAKQKPSSALGYGRAQQTPLTVEVFFEEVMPRIEEVLEEKVDKYRNDVLDYKVETVGEIKALREEVIVVNHQYERSDKRLTRVEKKLKLAPLDF